MAESFELDMKIRTDLGKGASRRLRRTGMVPAVIYGGGGEPRSLQVEANSLNRHLDNEAFYSHILMVKVDGKGEKAVLKDLQRHPSKPTILHLDLLRVSSTEKLHMRVPLHFMGAEGCPGVKLGGGVVSHPVSDVEISCLPADLPEFLEIDMSMLDLGESLHLSDISVPKGVEITALAHGVDHDFAVAAVYAKKGGSDEDEEETTGEAEADGDDAET